MVPTPRTLFDERQKALREFVQAYPTLVSAGPASLISTIAAFPFDSIKSRLQVKYYPSAWVCARDVIREEGIRGLFRGVTIPVVTITFIRTSSFSIYANAKKWLDARVGRAEGSLRRTALYGALGGLTSGSIISCASAPFELVKVQQQLEYLIATQRVQERARRRGLPIPARPADFKPLTGMRAAYEIFKTYGGIRGFYIGFPLHLTRDMLGTAFYFGIYDTIRTLGDRCEARGQTCGLPPPVLSFLLGSTSGIFSWLLVYPVDLLKTQVQRNALAGFPRVSAGKVFEKLLAKPTPGVHDQGSLRMFGVPIDRFLRLYRGLGISALRSFISHGITWMVIEEISRGLRTRAPDTKFDITASMDYLDYQ
ncbi:hypothetical protein MSPP1_002366 [Malassezia sp. CBS 17886]|nr:hypothetical protein MSPP1_002366 [Malassezia sp. CBS 17886]